MDTLTKLFNHIFKKNLKYSQPKEGSYPYIKKFEDRHKEFKEQPESIDQWLTRNKLK